MDRNTHATGRRALLSAVRDRFSQRAESKRSSRLRKLSRRKASGQERKPT